jgi:FkbM family methyltransferase
MVVRANFINKSIRVALTALADTCGFRIFRKDRFYYDFVHYDRWGTEPIHHLRHFADVDHIATCLDVGANTGQTAAYFSAVFPSATIHSFEPVNRTYEQLVSNTRHLPRVRTYRSALGATVGSAEISLAENNQLNSLVAGGVSGGSSKNREVIAINSVDAFMAEQGIDRINFLKTDTEGYDLEVLEGAAGALRKYCVDFVYSEVGFQPDDRFHTYFDRVLARLAAHEFVFLGLYETAFCDGPTHILHANALFGCKRSKLLKPWVE